MVRPEEKDKKKLGNMRTLYCISCSRKVKREGIEPAKDDWGGEGR